MDTRKDLKISTCGFDDGVAAGFNEDVFCVLEPPESGGSRSSGVGVGAALFRSGREESGAGVARGSRLRSDTAVASEPQVFVWPHPELFSWSCPLRGMSRLYWRLCPCVYAGDVGDGCAMELGDICWLTPSDAVRCEEAAMAAAEGSKDEWSTSARCSWIVGEGFLGADPRKSFLVENLRERLLPVDRS